MGKRLREEKPFNIQGLLVAMSYELYSKGGMDGFRSYAIYTTTFPPSFFNTRD